MNTETWQQRLSDKRMFDREHLREDAAYWTDSSPFGIVCSAHYRATAAGVEILEKGGNAIDAAIACSLALGVAEPAGSGLGGMAMMMIHHASQQRTFIIEGPCLAPIQATPQAVASAPRYGGFKAIAVPTNPAVLQHALKNYGTLPLADIIAPVLQLARDGYPITPLRYRTTKTYHKAIKKGTAAPFFLGPQKSLLPKGSLFQQPVLARTIEHIGETDFQDFYTGEIAAHMLADMKAHGGFICESDLTEYEGPTEIEPIQIEYGDSTVCSMPPPGGGTALLQMLQLFNQLKPATFDPDSPEAAVLFASIIHRARKDRRKYRLGTASIRYPNPPDLTSVEHAQQAAINICKRLDKSTGETSHICVFDRHGNVVSLTQSIERSFGSKIVTPELGFLYNGFMKAFKIENKLHPHYLKPRAKARSNAAPTIVFKNGIPIVAIGSTGSERMASGIFQVLVRLDYQSAFEAVKAPRLHCTPKKDVFLEQERFNPESVETLQQHGFTIHAFDAWAFATGGLNMATFDGNEYGGVSDPRRDGACAGPDR